MAATVDLGGGGMLIYCLQGDPTLFVVKALGSMLLFTACRYAIN